MEAVDVISFYRDLELLEIPSVGYPKAHRTHWIREVDPQSEILPFDPCLDITSPKIPYYLVRLGCPRQVELVRAVSRRICDEEELFLEERLGGMRGALATLTLDWAGRLVEGSFRVAPFVFATSRLAQKQDVVGIEEEISKFQDYAEECLGDNFAPFHQDLTIWHKRLAEIEEMSSSASEKGDHKRFERLEELRENLENQVIRCSDQMISLDVIRSIVDELAERIGLGKGLPVLLEAAPRQWRQAGLFPYPPGENGFSSFYFSELSRIIAQSENAESVSSVLQTFLDRRHVSGERVEIMLDQEETEYLLDGSRLAPARWPSSPEHSLSLAQQIGVADALSNTSPITAVNGPPGTGKTTLLRDVIANKVFERALRLADLKKPEDAFKVYGEMVLAKEEIVEGTEIVVASNGNRAVENITLEIPRKSEIDADCFPDASYLPEVAEAVSLAFEKPCEAWGAIALVMGKRSNIRTTMKSLRKGAHSQDGRIRKRGLISVLGDSGVPSGKEWADAVSVFRGEISAFKTIMEHRVSRDDDAVYLDLVGLEHLRTEGKRHAVSLWVDKDIEELRARIFLSALKLHELVLRSSASGLKQFLKYFEDVLSGEIECSPLRMLELWRTLFMVTPVISTTFASACSLPRQSGWIGCLMIDEAGQATPQSAVPALQRASKAVIVGDPAQLQPIFTVPVSVIEALRLSKGIPLDLSPSSESVQSIADASMRLGGALPDPMRPGQERWAGIPLRVHRRCAQPMFDVINEVSYGGKMVAGGDLVAAARRLRTPFVYSQWFDIRAAGGRGHVVREEIDCLRDVLARFKGAGVLGPGCEHSAMVVTPFAKVQWAAQGAIKDVFGKSYKEIEAGTIHKFQGREADVVFLLLGSAPGRLGEPSRQWAAAFPNLLNVAVSRAKTKLFVIGNYNEWSVQPHFKILAEAFRKYNLVQPYRRQTAGDELMF